MLRTPLVFLAWLLLFLTSLPLLAATDILIVCDEVPPMKVLARQLKERIHVKTTITSQTEMPSDLSAYATVIVYIHKTMNDPVETALIAYAKAGGKLLLIHHSISSEQRLNRYWLPFLQVLLPTGGLDIGGYKYFAPATFQMVNLAPSEYITTHAVTYKERVPFRWNDGDREYPGFTMTDTEVDVNHVFIGPRTTLLGLKYTEPTSGRLFMQTHAGWYKTTEKGMVIYFATGYKIGDFENPTYAQILTNAVEFPVAAKRR